MATRTLNQIRREILTWGEAHGQLQTVRFRAVADMLDEGDVTYPAMYFIYTGSRKERNVLRMSLQVGIGARALPEWVNVPEIWSDCNDIACDLLGYLDSAERPYKLLEGVAINPFEDANGDLFAGVLMDITLELGYPYDRCVTPYKTGGLLYTEDGKPLHTEDGDGIQTETAPPSPVLLESGAILLTENDLQLVLE